MVLGLKMANLLFRRVFFEGWSEREIKFIDLLLSSLLQLYAMLDR